MRLNLNLLVVVLALLIVAVLVVLRLAKPCEGSYKFIFDPRQVFFECTLLAIPKEDQAKLNPPAEQEASPKPNARPPSPGKPAEKSVTPGHDAVATSRPRDTVSCREVRGSLTFRGLLGNHKVADKVCRDKVFMVPASYRLRADLYRPQDDGSITFNTGDRHDGLQVWCNCKPAAGP